MGSLRNRLVLVFFAITLCALGALYLYVVPPLSSSLRDEELRRLSQEAQRDSRDLQRAIGSNLDVRAVDRLVRQAAEQSSARVTLLGVTRGTLGVQTYVKSDSTAEVRIRDLRFAVAEEAARTGRRRTGSEAGTGGRLGQAAVPLFFTGDGGRRVVGSVVVFSAPIDDVESDVAVIRRRIIVAGALALLLSTAAAWALARWLTRRVRRLERVAQRVARQDFTARAPVDSDDELGQLARALHEMQEQLAELDSARKRFIATASHELRTPIFSLGGFVELLEDEDIPAEDRRRFIAQLRQQVDRLGKLATDLLDLSKLEAGAVELRPEPTDMAALARAVTQEFTPALAAHESRIELRVGPGPLDAVCDPDRVAQVMRILLDNAITHTPPGTDMVVSATRRDGVVRLGVGDFGPGIHRTMLPRIFEPFATSDDAQGSGLGLAIAHELAERMDGRLVVDSHPGLTTFTLELPA